MRSLNLEISKMSTNDLEAYIDSRYEAGASQSELDVLELEYAQRVSEDDLNMSEDEPDMREAHDMGVDLEEWLAKEYYEFVHPQERVGCREDGSYFNPEAFNDFLSLKLKRGIKRAEIMEAARDVYEYRINLIKRQKSPNKLCNIPKELLIKR